MPDIPEDPSELDSLVPRPDLSIYGEDEDVGYFDPDPIAPTPPQERAEG